VRQERGELSRSVDCRQGLQPFPFEPISAIARYKALSARRRRTDAELDDEVASKLADPADDPELALQKKNRAEVLRRSLARLSPEHGEVIDLVYYHGKSVKEVAEKRPADVIGAMNLSVLESKERNRCRADRSGADDCNGHECLLNPPLKFHPAARSQTLVRHAMFPRLNCRLPRSSAVSP
jgi:hypothetical protein